MQPRQRELRGLDIITTESLCEQEMITLVNYSDFHMMLLHFLLQGQNTLHLCLRLTAILLPCQGQQSYS